MWIRFGEILLGIASLVTVIARVSTIATLRHRQILDQSDCILFRFSDDSRKKRVAVGLSQHYVIKVNRSDLLSKMQFVVSESCTEFCALNDGLQGHILNKSTNHSISQTPDALEWTMIAALSLVWGGSFFFVGVAVNELSSLSIVFSRVAIAAIVMWIIILSMRVPIPSGLRIWSTFLTMGLLNNVIPFSLIVWGQHQIASGLASILNATTPFFTVIVAHIWTRDEKINGRKCAGIVMGFAGVTVMMGSDLVYSLGKDIIAQLAVVAAALSYALAGVFGRRFKSMDIDPLVTTAGQVSTSTLMLLPLVLIIDRPWEIGIPSGYIIISLIGLGVLSTAIAYILYFQILARTGATNLLIVTFLIPVSAIFLGVAFLGEILEIEQIIGFIIIGTGLLIMANPSQKNLTDSF